MGNFILRGRCVFEMLPRIQSDYQAWNYTAATTAMAVDALFFSS